jgi:uncharacterized lipoprotein YbaY
MFLAVLLLSCAASALPSQPPPAASPVSNYLPLVTKQSTWQPTPGTSWQIQLSGSIDTSLDVALYDIDLFDTPQDVIDELHDRAQSGVLFQRRFMGRLAFRCRPVSRRGVG